MDPFDEVNKFFDFTNLVISRYSQKWLALRKADKHSFPIVTLIQPLSFHYYKTYHLSNKYIQLVFIIIYILVVV